MELDALAQVEGVREAAVLGLGDLGGEGRDHVGALRGEIQKTVEHLAGYLG
jgi:hypothetical protein